MYRPVVSLELGLQLLEQLDNLPSHLFTHVQLGKFALSERWTPPCLSRTV